MKEGVFKGMCSVAGIRKWKMPPQFDWEISWKERNLETETYIRK
jgi:hypothetical protein